MILSNITKKYGEKAVLKDISFSIKRGEILAVLGESGAGKTTLLNILAGLTAYEGEIDGKGGKMPCRRANCAYLFQDSKLLPNLTVAGNLQLVLPKEEWKNIPQTLKKVGLGGREREYPHTLSGGEKQRVAIARAFLYPHEILLMDEPFSSLDLALKNSLLTLVYALWKEKLSTVVFVTHDVREACALAHRALVLREGEIALDLPLTAEFPRDFFRSTQAEETLIRALVNSPRE